MSLTGSTEFTVKLRIPSWCPDPQLEVNRKKVPIKLGSDGYAFVDREWKTGDQITLHLKLEPRVVVGDHRNQGRLAIMYGPLVLAADTALISEAIPLSSLGVAGTNTSSLHFTPLPAPKTVKTWNDAEVFRIKAVAMKPSGNLKQSASFPVELIPYADAGGTGSAYRIWFPYEPPPAGRNLLRDGVEIRSRKPNAGSILDDNVETIAVTYNSKRAPEDWFGVELEEPVTVSRIVFLHGKTFHDGGWFDTAGGKPFVQFKASANGKWEHAADLKDYPAATATDPKGLKAAEKFSVTLEKPIEVFGIRVVGKPASGDNPKQSFSSCAELQAFGP
jgi:hypothetical protein